MTHKDIYTKFMIEYDKANVTSSYPSLTEYEIATVLDKAYNALIAQKVTGNNIRRAALEGDLKAISDIYPLIKTDKSKSVTSVSNTNVGYRDLPEDLLYFVSGKLTYDMSGLLEDGHRPMDDITIRPLPVKLVNHEMADKFIISAHNLPWIKTPVCYIEEDRIYVVYDSVNKPEVDNEYKFELTYIKEPNRFAKDITAIGVKYDNAETISYFDCRDNNGESIEAAMEDEYNFECNDTVAEELISLAVAFALENVESPRLNSKLNMRGLES